MFARSWLVVLAVVGGPLAFAQPLLVNGDFEAGTADWALSQQETARADFGTVAADSPAGGLAARVQIIHPDQPHRLQLMHDFPTGALTPGEAYELRFWARSQPGNAISVHVFNRDRPWSSLGVGRGLDLTDQWQEFRFPFRCRATPQPASKVDFFLGACTGVVWLDGVTIEPFTREPAAGAIRLEGEAWSASLTERGAVAEFVQRPGGQRLIAGAKGDPVYALAVAGEHGTRTLTDKDARGVAGEAADGTRRFRFDHGDIKVTCEVAVTADGLLAFTASVTNRGNEAVTGVRYPILRAPIQLGEHSADDAILLPAFDGGICENPKEAVPALGGFEAYYPGPASCQVLAYYDPRAGLYMAAQDAAGTPKRFTLNADVDFGFGFQHLFPTVPGRDAVPGYPVVIGTFVGDWQDAAALYREWSRKQAWCATPLRQKTPAWLARGALVTSFDPRRFSLDQLQAYLARFRALYGAPLIANSRGWERWGMWTGQEYLPPLPSEEHFTDAGRITRAADGRGMVMLSGYRWTIEKQQPDGSVHSSQERFDREVSRYAVCDAAGRPIIHTSDKADDWHGQKWAMLCRSTPFATDTIVDTAEYCVRRGYPVVHFDQEVSGAYQAGVCGSRAHGHPPGHGRYVHEGLVGLYRRLRERCGPANPDFVLSMEEPNELYLPYLNLCQCRPFGLTTEWPAVAPMTRTVPLFSFLYHDYLIQWAAFYPWKSAGRPEVSTAKGFAAGLMPGLQPYDNTLPAEGTTRYSGFFRRCMDLYLGPAREYLVFGRMLKAPPLNIPQRTLSLGKDRGETTVPAVWHSLWQLEDGRRGLVLLNPETEAHTLTFDLTTLTPAGATVRLVAPDAAAREIRAAGQVTVEAGDAALIEIIPERA